MGAADGRARGRIARRGIAGGSGDRIGRVAARREVAGLVGTVVFWLATAIGLLVAIWFLDPDVLDDLGERLGEVLPRLGVAALVLIGGHAVSVLVAAMVGQSARKATGVRQRGLRSLQAGSWRRRWWSRRLLGVQPSSSCRSWRRSLPALCLRCSAGSAAGRSRRSSAGRALRHQLRRAGSSSAARSVGSSPCTPPAWRSSRRRVAAHIPNRCMLARPYRVHD